ncbi:putative acylpyruvase FAHD1 [Citrus sinensis]|uniref:Acylpyruvase FAHD1 n=3 Tax=Citrus sinensis TaxID=2711 RepID=A0ACB8I953_CITSI|nr:putative acylpyruvase FAHD1 [Citrus sinensis]
MIQYLGNKNFYGEDAILVSARNKNGKNDLAVLVFVDPVNDSPFIQVPGYIVTIKANVVRFRGIIMQQLFYQSGEGHDVLKVKLNDMGHYGCRSDCTEKISLPLFAEATVNLISRRPMSSELAHTLGSGIVIEFFITFFVGVLLLFFTRKCALLLVNERRSRGNSEPSTAQSYQIQALPKSAVPDPHNLELWLKVDGEIPQKGFTKDMIFKIPYLISHISSIMTLVQGDVMLTLNRAYYAYEGTPQGVGPVKVGQKITAGITGLLDVHFDIEKRRRPGSA